VNVVSVIPKNKKGGENLITLIQIKNFIANTSRLLPNKIIRQTTLDKLLLTQIFSKVNRLTAADTI
jgi:hypothetical protein